MKFLFLCEFVYTRSDTARTHELRTDSDRHGRGRGRTVSARPAQRAVMSLVFSAKVCPCSSQLFLRPAEAESRLKHPHSLNNRNWFNFSLYSCYDTENRSIILKMIGRLFIFFVFICIFTRSFSKFDRPLCITYYTKPSQQSSLYMQNNLKCINFCSWQNTLRKGVLSAFNNASLSFIHAHSCLYSCSASSCITLTCVHFFPVSYHLSDSLYHLNLCTLFSCKLPPFRQPVSP